MANLKKALLKKSSKNRAKRYAELEQQYLSHPGIKDLMIVYDHWKEAHKAVQAHQGIRERSYTATSSDSSNPKALI